MRRTQSHFSMQLIAKQTGLALAAIVLATVAFPAFGAAEETHRYIIGFKSTVVDQRVSKSSALARLGRIEARAAVRARVMQTYGVQTAEDMPSIGAVVVNATDHEINELAADAAAQQGDGATVRYIEEDAPLQLLKTANDALFSQGLLWGLKNYAGPDVKALDAWEISTGSDTVVVGVIDTGIDYNHPDLAPNMWRNGSEIPANGIDDDSNGLVDDYYGYDFINVDGDPFDDHYHGTHVAGTIGARGNNGIGVAGVNWSVKLMALKFLGANGSGWTSGAVGAVLYAIAQRQRGENIRVLNGSFGGGGYSQALNDAILAANNAGIVFVAAAGNSALNNDQALTYPANYSADNVVSVAAITNSGSLAGFSNYGATKVHLAAPGVSIASTIPVSRGSYAYLSGTSMAAPHVAGVVALMYAVSPNLTPAEVRSALIQTVTPLGTLIGKTVSHGTVNAAGALTLVGSTIQKLTISGTVTADGAALSGATINGGELGTQMSDANGLYTFRDVPRDRQYTLSVSKVGYRFDQSTAGGTLSADATHNFNGAPYRYSISGRVSAAGAAIQGALVSAGALGSALTDAAGNYLIASVPYGANYTLTVSKLGYRFNVASYSGTVSGDAVRSFIGVAALYSVSGRVVSARTGLAGVRVDGGALGAAHTNPNGEFFFNNIPYGQEYLLSFSKRGYSFSQNEIAGEATANLRLNLTASVARHVVSGVVLVNGLPLAGVRLTDKELGSTVSDAEGRFLFDAAKYNTRYQVTASKAGYRFRQATKGGVLRDDVELQFVASGSKQGSFRVARRR